MLAATYTQDLDKDLHSVTEPTTGHYNFSLRITVGLQTSLQNFGLNFSKLFGT